MQSLILLSHMEVKLAPTITTGSWFNVACAVMAILPFLSVAIVGALLKSSSVLITMTPTAPASAASNALVWKGHTPRCVTTKVPLKGLSSPTNTNASAVQAVGEWGRDRAAVVLPPAWFANAAYTHGISSECTAALLNERESVQGGANDPTPRALPRDSGVVGEQRHGTRSSGR